MDRIRHTSASTIPAAIRDIQEHDMSLRLQHIISCTFGLALSFAIAGSAAAQGQGRVVGEVADENGTPLAGVQITATNPNANPSEFTTTSGNDGNFAIIGLVSGQWMFRADCTGACGERNGSPRGYSPSEGPSNITQTRNPPIDFELIRIRHPLAQMLGDDAVAGIDLDAIDARITAADGAFNGGSYQEAISGYEAVLAQLPALSNLHFNIGNAYAQMQESDAAIAAYDRALAADPQNQNVQIARARVRLAAGTADAADRQLLEQAATSLSASREDLYNQGEQGLLPGGRGRCGPVVRAREHGRSELGEAALQAGPRRVEQGRHGHRQGVLPADDRRRRPHVASRDRAGAGNTERAALTSVGSTSTAACDTGLPGVMCGVVGRRESPSPPHDGPRLLRGLTRQSLPAAPIAAPPA